MNKVEFRAEEVPPPSWIPAAGRFVKKVLKTLERKNSELSVLFCDNKYIKSLNAQYRNKDEPTDVLSFPQGGPVLLPGGEAPEPAGDIVISLDALEENARFFSVSKDEELRRLLVHGILHLFGEDHITNNKKEPMLRMQEEILACLKDERIIPAGNIPVKEKER